MKRTAYLSALLLLAACKAESKHCETEIPPTGKNTVIYTYDSQEAQRIGADENGMKPYVVAILKEGPAASKDSSQQSRLMRAHLENIEQLETAGKLSVAGPFTDKGELRGIYIFNVQTLAEAEQLTKTDPAVKAGALKMELHTWYGPAAVSEVAERQKIYTREKS